MISKIKVLVYFSFISSLSLFAKLNVVTTLSDFKPLVKEVGGPYVKVDSISEGNKDPHFLSAKPSYIMKVKYADLVIANGLDLEVGWLPKLLSAARNPKVVEGKKGYLELGMHVSVLDVPKGPVTRAHGDVHPDGNPHVTLDPIRLGEMAIVIADRLSELDLKNTKTFKNNALALQKRLLTKTKEWQTRVKKTGIKSVVTYHETLLYFLDRFGIEKAAILEPFPGVPPTAKHTLTVINEASKKGTKLILIEQYFDMKAAEKPASQIPDVQVVSVPVAVQEPNIPTNEALLERLVTILEKHKVNEVKKVQKKVEAKNKEIKVSKEIIPSLPPGEKEVPPFSHKE